MAIWLIWWILAMGEVVSGRFCDAHCCKLSNSSNTLPAPPSLPQCCSPSSPASRAACSWGGIVEGDQVLAISAREVRALTRLDCVKALKGGEVSRLCQPSFCPHPQTRRWPWGSGTTSPPRQLLDWAASCRRRRGRRWRGRRPPAGGDRAGRTAGRREPRRPRPRNPWGAWAGGRLARLARSRWDGTGHLTQRDWLLRPAIQGDFFKLEPP